MCSNAEFEYLYRDASNYKFWGSVVFENPSTMSLEEVEERITRSLDSQELFIASQIRLPEVFPFEMGKPTEDDHCYHEFASINPTLENSNDLYDRSLTQFVEEIESVAFHGWRVFDLHDVRR